MNDEQLLNFDASGLAHYEEGDGERRLQGEHADLYRNHLLIALHLDGWRERSRPAVGVDAEWQAGFQYTLQEVAAHLRQGDYLPGGTLYAEVESS